MPRRLGRITGWIRIDTLALPADAGEDRHVGDTLRRLAVEPGRMPAAHNSAASVPRWTSDQMSATSADLGRLLDDLTDSWHAVRSAARFAVCPGDSAPAPSEAA